MGTASPADVTQLLQAWSHGDERALEALIPLIYRGLRQRAHRYTRGERPGHTEMKQRWSAPAGSPEP